MSSIEAALIAIESLQPGEQCSYSKIAAKYHCNRTTLARRHQGVSISRDIEAQNCQALHPQLEQELLRYIRRLTERGLSPILVMIQHFASDIVKESLEKARLTGISSATRLILSHAERLGSIAHATRLILSQSIASTSSFYAASSANTI